jgi:hypothetical protein
MYSVPLALSALDGAGVILETALASGPLQPPDVAVPVGPISDRKVICEAISPDRTKIWWRGW